MRNSKAFSLTEILIAVAILAVFITLPIIAFSQFTKGSADQKRRNDLMKISQSLEQYKAERGSYPATLQELVDQGYLPELPTDPKNGQAIPGELGLTYGYAYESDGKTYKLLARLENGVKGGQGITKGTGSGSIGAGTLTGICKDGIGSGAISGNIAVKGRVSGGVLTGTYVGTASGNASGTISGPISGQVGGNAAGLVEGNGQMTGTAVNCASGQPVTGSFTDLSLTGVDAGSGNEPGPGIYIITPDDRIGIDLPIVEATQLAFQQPTYEPVIATVYLSPTGYGSGRLPTVTGTPTNTPTNTPVPPTPTRTNTPVPPTPTRTNTPVPPTPTRTNTPVPPTPTSISKSFTVFTGINTPVDISHIYNSHWSGSPYEYVFEGSTLTTRNGNLAWDVVGTAFNTSLTTAAQKVILFSVPTAGSTRYTGTQDVEDVAVDDTAIISFHAYRYPTASQGFAMFSWSRQSPPGLPMYPYITYATGNYDLVGSRVGLSYNDAYILIGGSRMSSSGFANGGIKDAFYLEQYSIGGYAFTRSLGWRYTSDKNNIFTIENHASNTQRFFIGGSVLSGKPSALTDSYLAEVDMSVPSVLYSTTKHGDGIVSIIQGIGGGYIGLAESAESVGGNYYSKSYIFKFSEGAGLPISWGKVIDPSSTVISYPVEVVPSVQNDGYIVLANENGNFTLTKISTTGGVIWKKKYSRSGYTLTAKAILKVSDGYIIGGNQGFVVRMDSNGDAPACASYLTVANPPTISNTSSSNAPITLVSVPVTRDLDWDGTGVTSVATTVSNLSACQ